MAILLIYPLLFGCKPQDQKLVQGVTGSHRLDTTSIWLSHEHVLVDFIGANSIQPDTWNHDSIIKVMTPYLESLKIFNVSYFVDATPSYLGRDVLLLEKLVHKTGIEILSNTGLYAAGQYKYLPAYAFEKPAEELAEMWIDEYNNGINGTLIKPGFIKISINNGDPLKSMDEKIVKAAAITHLNTGLTIASHTGKAEGLWPQLNLLKEMGVSSEVFIWVHAQNENDHSNYLKAAREGCWISLDGVGSDLETYTKKLLFAKENGILSNILISHDAGWYDPQKETQSIRPYTTIFTDLIPELRKHAFTEDEINLLIKVNPGRAFSIKVITTDLDAGE